MTTIEGVKDYCREVFPGEPETRRRSKIKAKVMSLEQISGSEVESDSECDTMGKEICGVVRRWDKQPCRNEKRKFIPTKVRIPNRISRESIDKLETIKPALFCNNCLSTGHAAISCTEQKRVYCYRCGVIGETTDTCESEICAKTKNEAMSRN